MKNLIVVFALILITACSSIPFGSMIKIASMNDKDLLSIQAEKVKVRITVNQPAELETKNIKLVLKFDYSKTKIKEYLFVLKFLSTQKIVDNTSWFSNSQTRNIYEFEIAKESFDMFTQYQKEFIEYGKPQKYFWTVYYYLKKRPEKNTALNLDLELKLAETEPYFYALKGAELNIN